MKSALLCVFACVLAAVFGSPAAFANEFATPTIQSVSGHATITGTPTYPIVTAYDGDAYAYYAVSLDPCGGIPCSYNPRPGVLAYATIPLVISYSLTASAGANGQGIAEFAVYDVTEGYGFDDEKNCSFDGGMCGHSAFTNLSYDYNAAFCDSSDCFAQLDGYVYLHAYAAAGGFGQVDPTFAIDPSFLKQFPNATLTIAPVTLTAVPEPATWALTILGVAAIGLALRRRCVLSAA